MTKRQRPITDYFSGHSKKGKGENSALPKQGSRKYAFGVEGIDMGSSLTLLREQICDELLKDLEANAVILVRAPPYCGKTSLASLVAIRAKSLKKEYDAIQNFTFLFEEIDISAAKIKFSDNNEQTVESLVERNERHKVLIIIDEIQTSYNTNFKQFERLWNIIKATMQRPEKI